MTQDDSRAPQTDDQNRGQMHKSRNEKEIAQETTGNVLSGVGSGEVGICGPDWDCGI